MFRPSVQRIEVLLLMAVLSIILFITVSYTTIEYRKDDYQLKIDTAKKMESALDSLKPYGRDFESPYRDPFDTRLIFNRRFSPLLTDIGKYQSKATVLKPNFAALVINEFTKAGLEAGDTVAISMTGSMPGANIAVLIACETMNLHYISISSLGASEWGATDTTLSWPKMEKILYDKKIISHTSNKFSYGGAGDYLKKGTESRQDYGGENQREQLDQIMRKIYPDYSLNDLFILTGLSDNNQEFAIDKNGKIPIAREYYALPLSIARRLEVYDFGNIAEHNKKLFMDVIKDYDRNDIRFSNISRKSKKDIENNKTKNKYGKAPEALSALLKVCDEMDLKCSEPTQYEFYDDLNKNNDWDPAFCSDDNFLNQDSCEKADEIWTNEEPYNDINKNEIRDKNTYTKLNNDYINQIKSNISQDYNLSPYKAYINVGGGVSSFGYKNQEKLENYYGFVHPDTIKKILPSSSGRQRGVMIHFAEANIPIINFIEIEKLVENFDIEYFNGLVDDKDFDINRDGMIDIGKGNLFYTKKYNLLIVWISLILSLSSILYIGLISYRQINRQMREYNPNE